MKSDEYYSEIKKRYGNIRRARGCFLYTQKNVRLTDLWQEGGRAILGWDSAARTVFKNAMQKNLVGSFETGLRAQLEKALSDLLGGRRKIFLFSKKKAAMEAALFLDADSSSVYKPFCGADYSAVKNVVVAPPLPWTNNFFVLAARDADAKIPSENFPPALLAAAARSVYDLILALKERGEKDFFVYDTILKKFFERSACWLKPKIPQEKYDDFVLRAMDSQVLISPDFFADSLVPFGADKGVLKKLEALDAEF